EEVIQYVYERYGRDRAAQVANVVTYRPRSALREMAKATGVAPGQADALGKWVDRWAAGPEAFGELVSGAPLTSGQRLRGGGEDSPLPPTPPTTPLGAPSAPVIQASSLRASP